MHLVFALCLIPCAAFVAAAVDYARATRSRADLQSATDAAALNALNASNRGKAAREAAKVLRASTELVDGSTEDLTYDLTWHGSDTVEVQAALTVKGRFGSILDNDTTVRAVSRATRPTTTTQRLVVKPVFNCPYTNDRMSLTVVETDTGGAVKLHPVYSNATPMPDPIAVEIGGGSSYRFLVATEQNNRKGAVVAPSTIKAYADQKPAYMEQVGSVCDKNSKVVQGWETPFDPAPYASFLRFRYEYTCEGDQKAGEARLVK